MSRLVMTRSNIRMRARVSILYTNTANTGHIVVSYCLQILIRPANLLSAISYYKISHFKKSTREHEIHNYLSFGCLLNIKVAKQQIIVNFMFSC